MNKLFTIIIAITAYALMPAVADSFQLPKSESELISRFKQFHAAGDLAGLMSLKYNEGYPDELRTIDEQMLDDLLKKDIVSISVEEIPAPMLEMMKSGLPYQDMILVPNITPAKLLKVTLSPGEGMTDYQAPIGIKNGIWYLTSTKPKEE